MTRRPRVASPPMVIAIPSKGRAGKVHTLDVLPSATLYVPALEVAAYANAGARSVVPVPDTVRGITATRNWILRHADAPRVVMIDDDVREQGWIQVFDHTALKTPLDEATWLAEFTKLFEVTEQMNYRVWGTSTESSLRAWYPYFPFRFRSYITASCCGIVNDGRTLFDEAYPVKEDYELCARLINEDGGVVAARYLYWQNSHWHDKGGCHDYRTQAMERDCIRRLTRAYPGVIRAVERSTNDWAIEIIN
jgi:hypothetical protein